MEIISNPAAKEKFKSYPPLPRKRLKAIRKLIIETARSLNEISYLEETLKWGEPSYLTKYGSTVRMDWKEKSPNQYAIYFKCTSKLVSTFKEVFPDFEYEKTRAILFDLKDDNIPVADLKKCIQAALQYHKVKHLVKLGITK